jgi:hypothetical protein
VSWLRVRVIGVPGIDASAGQELVLGTTNDCPGLSWGVVNHHDWRPPLVDWANAFHLCFFGFTTRDCNCSGCLSCTSLGGGAHQLVSHWIDWILALCTQNKQRWSASEGAIAHRRDDVQATISIQCLAHAFSGNPPLFFYALVSSINQLISLSKFEILQSFPKINQATNTRSGSIPPAGRPAQHDH